MVVVIDYRPLFKDAKERYDKFKTGYTLVKKSEQKNQPLPIILESIVKMWCRDAFSIHPEIRETISGLNEELVEMVQKGFLELKKDEIVSYDPVTQKMYYDSLFNLCCGKSPSARWGLKATDTEGIPFLKGIE